MNEEWKLKIEVHGKFFNVESISCCTRKLNPTPSYRGPRSGPKGPIRIETLDVKNISVFSVNHSEEPKTKDYQTSWYSKKTVARCCIFCRTLEPPRSLIRSIVVLAKAGPRISNSKSFGNDQTIIPTVHSWMWVIFLVALSPCSNRSLKSRFIILPNATENLSN